MQYQPTVPAGQTQYQIEPDCRAKALTIPLNAKATEISELLWDHAALLGEYVLSNRERSLVLRTAAAVFRDIIAVPNVKPNLNGERVIALACVYLTAERDGDISEKGLWEYLLAKLSDGWKPNVSDQVLRSNITTAIEHVFRTERRFYSREGHRFFNTLRLHAFVPVQTVWSMFNLLYYFYESNLDCQYTEGDNSYRIFVKKICQRWESDVPASDGEEWKIRSDYVAASFRELFQQRPEYTAALCDALVLRIDAILRGERDMLRSESRWDQLLIQWYEEKAAAERTRMERKIQEAHRERVITVTEKIVPKYSFTNGKLSLFLPRIRLPEINAHPQLVLLRGDSVILSRILSVYGNELCYTTKEEHICLSDLPETDWDSPMEYRLLIRCEGETVYDSGAQLFRTYMLFRQDGEESPKLRQNADTVYLIANRQTDIFAEDAEDNIVYTERDFQIYELRPATLQYLTVGTEALLDRDSKELHFKLSGQRKEGVTVSQGERSAAVMQHAPRLQIAVSAPELLKQYILQIDSETVPLYQAASGRPITQIPLPDAQDMLHHVSLRSFSDGRVLLSEDYCVIPALSYSFTPAVFHSRRKSGTVRITENGKETAVSFTRTANEAETAVPLANGLTLHIPLPLLSARFGDKEALSLPQYLWKDDLPADGFLHIIPPPDCTVQVLLGAAEIPAQRQIYDITGAVRNLHTQRDSLPLGLVLRHGNGAPPEQLLLTNLVLRPMLSGSPVRCEGRRITWQPEGQFIGAADAKACVRISHGCAEIPQEFTCSMRENALLIETFTGAEGDYPCEIRLLPDDDDLFQEAGEGELLYACTLPIREPAETRFADACAMLRIAEFGTNFWWSRSEAALPEDSLRLVDIEYTAESVPLNGKLSAFQSPAPCFTAYLQHYDPDSGFWVDFNYTASRKGYFLINTVSFWHVIAADSTDYLILARADGKRIPFMKTTGGALTVAERVPDSVQRKKLRHADRFRFEKLPYTPEDDADEEDT